MNNVLLCGGNIFIYYIYIKNNIMAKGKNAQKNEKKESTKSIKEKRAEKKAKAAAKRD